ncbi:MAG: GntR family transcriptional regulator [Lactobacillus sp.]|jgi:GntR family transcriptional regulator|nr:GntR family transcriptional regulator [Lactobacillus sp.]
MATDSYAHLAYYERLVLQIKTQILQGILLPGDRLPSVREMAKQEQLNPNTVAKAYKQLDQDGITYVEPGRGTFIAEPLTKVSTTAIAAFRPKFEAIVVEAKSLGISVDLLRQWLNEAEGNI